MCALDMSACWALSQPAAEESPGFCKEEGVFLTQPLFLAALEQEENTWAQAKKPSLCPPPCKVCLRPEFSPKEPEAELLQQAGHFPFLRKGHPSGAAFYVPAEATCLQMSPAGSLSHTVP